MNTSTKWFGSTPRSVHPPESRILMCCPFNRLKKEDDIVRIYLDGIVPIRDIEQMWNPPRSKVA
uniref:Uncharacterized protein n=1 Tax=Arundo donax TaxID=35708 RepID=A0A0A9B1J0_ARUDO